MITGIHHVSLLVTDLARSTKFYCDVLGLTLSDKRPALDFDGAWFQLDGQQIHLICPAVTEPSNTVDKRCGQDQHVALRVENIAQLIDKLKNANVHFEESRSGRPAIFCRDPDGNALEFVEEH